MNQKPLSSLLLLLSTLLIVWLFSFWAALSSAVSVWSSSETFKHCFFILPLVLYLFYERKQELRIVNFAPNYWLGFALLFTFALNLAGELLGINLITHASAYLALVSIVWLCLGNDFIKKFWFPMLFLGFCVPFGEELVPILQDVTAYLTVELVKLIGIPIYRDGLYLYVPNGTFLVAEACAGIRFLIASFALGTLFAYLNYRTRWKFFAFIVASLLVPIIANGIRAFGIVAIGYSTDMEHAVGADHLVYGWFFFAFVLLLLFGIGQIGQENTRIEVSSQQPDGNVTRTSLKQGVVVVLLALAIPLYAVSINTQHVPPNPEHLRDKISDLGRLQERNFDWQPMLVSPLQTWSGNIDSLPIYFAYYHTDNNESELVSGLNRYFNIDIYTRKSFSRVSTDKGLINRVELVDVSGKQISLFYWFSIDNKRTAGSLQTKVNQALSKLNADRGEGYFVAVEAQDLSQAELLLAPIGL